MYKLFFEICRATLRITKWAVAKWAIYELVGLSYEVGNFYDFYEYNILHSSLVFKFTVI